MVAPSAPRVAAALAILLTSVASAQAPSFDKAREVFRESIKKPAIADRIAGIRELADAKDVRGADDLIAAIRVQEQQIPKKREEIERVGKENREVWKPLDDWLEQQKAQGKDPKGVPAEIVNRVEPRARALQEKLNLLTRELNVLEATRAAVLAGLGRLITSVDASARAPKILELASAAQKATDLEEKVFFIRMFAAIRAPESRDALIELARLSQDGQVRTAAIGRARASSPTRRRSRRSARL